MMAANKTQATSTLMLIAALLSACAAPPPTPGGRRAPVEEFDIQRGERAAAAPTPAVSPVAVPVSPQAAPVVAPLPVTPKAVETTAKIHVVQKGDTLYSIAFLNGVDFREVAELNNLADPAAIKIGQQLRLNVPVTETVAVAAETQAPVAQPAPQPGGIKQQPKVGKLAYAESALVRAENLQNDKAPTASAAAKPQTGGDKAASDEEVAAWGMPTAGKLIAGFSESDNRKGVDITGTKGQPVVASASGKVVYSGSGLRGYGKLIIVKHNKTYLSAYAHNDRILVKEGQSVSKGQKIAEMGNSDADQVKLHFEIRKLGKPVDPAKFLPLSKS
jgi:lipoprotein NlpD